MIHIRRSHQGWRWSLIGCEGCYNSRFNFVGFIIPGLWVELDFLHSKEHAV